MGLLRVRLYQYWLTAAILSLALFAQAISVPKAAPLTSVARDGIELAVLTLTGAVGPAPKATPAPKGVQAVTTPGPKAESNPPAVEVQSTADQATPSPPPIPSPKGKRIFIDAGHGGAEIGSAHANGGQEDVVEKEVNLWIALRLADMLRQDGYEVQLSRTTDRAVAPGAGLAADLQARVDLANQFGADLLISIHHNGNDNPSLRGTEVYYCGDRAFGDKNRRLASLVQEALLRNMRQAGYDPVDRGIKDDAYLGHLALLAPYNLPRPSQMPGILGEALFVTNDSDAAALRRPDIREAIARGYFEGIKAYFGDNAP